MHRDTNRQILEEIRRLDSLKYGSVIGRNDSGNTVVTSLGRVYSEVLGHDLDIALKEYSGKQGNVLNMMVGCELGLIDLVEENLPHLVEEFPVFHGVFLDSGGKPIGVITEDFSQNGTVPVRNIDRNRESLPYEIQELLGRSEDLYDLATTSFLVGDGRRIGDLGEFTSGDVKWKLKLVENYSDMGDYSVKVPLEKK